MRFEEGRTLSLVLGAVIMGLQPGSKSTAPHLSRLAVWMWVKLAVKQKVTEELCQHPLFLKGNEHKGPLNGVIIELCNF